MPEAAPTPAELALEKSGLEFLRSGKFRKARDAFKSLKKSQPSRALPLLIEANLGLANEMMSKGLVSEANQVLAYLKTIAPDSGLTLAAPVKATHPADAWAAMVPLAAQRLSATPQPDDGIRAADEIILGAESPEHPGHPDAEAILRAMELGYGSEVTDQTATLLRSIPRSSPFSHWVFFFKGMAALESGSHARAAGFFRKIPESSLLQASLPVLLTLCGSPQEAPQPASRTVRALCAWAGHPALADPLLQADPLWRKNRRAKAFTLLAKNIPNLLCFGARGFKADLSRFLTTESIQTRKHDFDYRDTLLDYVSLKSRAVAGAVVDQSFFAIDFADFPACAHSHFQTAVSNLDRITRATPISPAMHSRIFTRLAESYIASVKKDPEDLCSPPNAKKALEHAIKHDPDHLHAWLTQCDLLSMGRDASAYHRFLDDLTKRFPDEKEVLIRNGDCCIGRGSHTKALRNFEKAAKIDSVDPRIARGILRARLGSAEAAYKKRYHPRVNWELIESLASSNNTCPEFALWRLRVRRIVLIARFGSPEENINALAASTLPLAPSPFRFEVACRIGIAKYKLTFKPGILDKMLPSRPKPQSLADFLAVIDEIETIEEDSAYNSSRNISRDIFLENEDLLLECIADRKDLTTLLTKIFNTRMPDITLASPVIERWFARDPSDLVLRYLSTFYVFPWLANPRVGEHRDIVNALSDSPDPDHQRLLLLMEKNKKRLIAEKYGDPQPGKSPKLDLDYDPHGKGGEYDDEYDDDSGMEAAINIVDQAMAKMSPSERLAIISELLGPGMGSPVDPIYYNPPPKKPSKPKQGKAPKPSPRKTTSQDPDQLSFDSQIIPPPAP